jgi:hypothetical protein
MQEVLGSICFLFPIPLGVEVNPSTPQPEGLGLLRVDPERRFSTPPKKAGFGAAEWVKFSISNIKYQTPPSKVIQKGFETNGHSTDGQTRTAVMKVDAAPRPPR